MRRWTSQWLQLTICLFKQGRLESTAYIKGGDELTTLLEKVSGSFDYKTEYEKIINQNESNEKISFNLSKEISDIRKQKKKLEQMDGYMADSKDLLDEREKIIEQIEQAKVLAYQLAIDELKAQAKETKESVDHSVSNRNKISKWITNCIS